MKYLIEDEQKFNSILPREVVSKLMYRRNELDERREQGYDAQLFIRYYAGNENEPRLLVVDTVDIPTTTVHEFFLKVHRTFAKKKDLFFEKTKIVFASKNYWSSNVEENSKWTLKDIRITPETTVHFFQSRN